MTSTATVLETAEQARAFVLELVENYRDEEPSTQHLVNARSGFYLTRMTKKTQQEHALYDLLEVAPIVEYLSWRDLSQLRCASDALNKGLFPAIDRYMADFFKPTVELKTVVEQILLETKKEGASWMRFVTMVLVPFLDKLEKRYRQISKVSPLLPPVPLLFRVNMLVKLVRNLDGSSDPLFYAMDDSHVANVSWNIQQPAKLSPYGGGWLNLQTRNIEDTVFDSLKRLGCPDLRYLCCQFCGILTEAFYVVGASGVGEEEEQSPDPKVNKMWARSLGLLNLDDCTSFFVLEENGTSKMGWSNTQEGVTGSFGAVCAGPFNYLKLLLSLHDDGDSLQEQAMEQEEELVYSDPGPRGMVLWYAFLVAQGVSPFVEAAAKQCSPETLWTIVTKSPIADSKMDEAWTAAFAYYNGLSLYRPGMHIINATCDPINPSVNDLLGDKKRRLE